MLTRADSPLRRFLGLGTRTANQVHFYYKFTAFYSVWLIALPAIVLGALSASEQTRAQKVNAAELAVLAIAHTAMVLLYYPNKTFNKSFPFHSNAGDMVKTRTRTILVEARAPIASHPHSSGPPPPPPCACFVMLHSVYHSCVQCAGRCSAG